MMSEIKLRRQIERWQNCDPNVMAMQSEAALRFAFSDMRHDILALHKELERLRAQIKQTASHAQKLIEQQNDIISALEDTNAGLVQERDRLCITVKDLSGAMLSVNRSRNQKIMIEGDDEPCYWQREEWVKWIVELANKARESMQ